MSCQCLSLSCANKTFTLERKYLATLDSYKIFVTLDLNKILAKLDLKLYVKLKCSYLETKDSGHLQGLLLCYISLFYTFHEQGELDFFLRHASKDFIFIYSFLNIVLLRFFYFILIGIQPIVVALEMVLAFRSRNVV